MARTPKGINSQVINKSIKGNEANHLNDDYSKN